MINRIEMTKILEIGLGGLSYMTEGQKKIPIDEIVEKTFKKIERSETDLVNCDKQIFTMVVDDLNELFTRKYRMRKNELHKVVDFLMKNKEELKKKNV